MKYTLTTEGSESCWLERRWHSMDGWFVVHACWSVSSRLGCAFIDDGEKEKHTGYGEEEGTGEKSRGREGRDDDKGMGGGLDDGVMCCFRANCFCDSGTTSFIAIGYK